MEKGREEKTKGVINGRERGRVRKELIREE